MLNCTNCFLSFSQVLLEARLKRPRPHLDDKILTSWNALMISGLCHAGAARDRKVKRFIYVGVDTDMTSALRGKGAPKKKIK